MITSAGSEELMTGQYQGKTPYYGIPYMKDGDQMSEQEESRIMMIIENLLRAGVLAEGETRSYREGIWQLQPNQDGTYDVILSGSPALRGIASSTLVEVYGTLVWRGIKKGQFYRIYVRTTPETLFSPEKVTPIFTTSELKTPDVLFLATLDTNNPEEPKLNYNPERKPIGANLYQLLNSPTNPFGDLLKQTAIEILRVFTVNLGETNTILVRQLNPNATQPILTIQNRSSKPEINSTGELRLADKRNPTGIPLTEDGVKDLPKGAKSILGALSGRTYAVELKPKDGVLSTDASQGNFYHSVLDSSVTLGNPTNGQDGQRVIWRIKQDSTGGRSVSFDSAFRFVLGEEVPDFATSSVKTHYIEAVFNEAEGFWDVLKIAPIH